VKALGVSNAGKAEGRKQEKKKTTIISIANRINV
jgi:hypothetical protein